MRALVLAALLSATVAHAAYPVTQQCGGPCVCAVYEKGAVARSLFPLFKLQYATGYSLMLCWWTNAPYMRGHVMNREQQGVCPVGGVKINGTWIFTRDCDAGELFR